MGSPGCQLAGTIRLIASVRKTLAVPDLARRALLLIYDSSAVMPARNPIRVRWKTGPDGLNDWCPPLNQPPFPTTKAALDF